MELRKDWFPLVVALVWVALTATSLSSMASFSAAARVQQAHLVHGRAAQRHGGERAFRHP